MLQKVGALDAVVVSDCPSESRQNGSALDHLPTPTSPHDS
jgi:hypothetical protein